MFFIPIFQHIQQKKKQQQHEECRHSVCWSAVEKYLSSNKSLLKNIIVITICLRFRVEMFQCSRHVCAVQIKPKFRALLQPKHDSFALAAPNILHQITTIFFSGIHAAGEWK
jgi:hypothetical protein